MLHSSVHASQGSGPATLPRKYDFTRLYTKTNTAAIWNSAPIDDVTLRQYLDQTLQMSPEPELHFQPDPQARYEVVDRVLAIIKRANVNKLGFVGNEYYAREF